MASPRGIILGLSLVLSAPLAAEAAVFRLRPSGLDGPEPLAALDLAPTSPQQENPFWVEWILKLADGRLFSLPQPSWQGSLVTAGSLWRLKLDAGYKERPDLGVGPTVAVMGRLGWPSWALDAQVSLLGSATGLGTSSELVLSIAPVKLQVRAWMSPGANLLGQSVSLRLTQRF
ncbi:hypothetical protein J7643_07595 [bacterium]|nr:hypothetical protein [bacterium]